MSNEVKTPTHHGVVVYLSMGFDGGNGDVTYLFEQLKKAADEYITGRKDPTFTALCGWSSMFPPSGSFRDLLEEARRQIDFVLAGGDPNDRKETDDASR